VWVCAWFRSSFLSRFPANLVTARLFSTFSQTLDLCVPLFVKKTTRLPRKRMRPLAISFGISTQVPEADLFLSTPGIGTKCASQGSTKCSHPQARSASIAGTFFSRPAQILSGCFLFFPPDVCRSEPTRSSPPSSARFFFSHPARLPFQDPRTVSLYQGGPPPQPRVNPPKVPPGLTGGTYF